MKTEHNYKTASIALEELNKKGYTTDFNVEFEKLHEKADEHIIDISYHYEGESDPSDENNIYGIRNKNTQEKGVFVTGNLAFLEGKKRDIILNLEMKNKENENS